MLEMKCQTWLLPSPQSERLTLETSTEPTPPTQRRSFFRNLPPLPTHPLVKCTIAYLIAQLSSSSFSYWTSQTNQIPNDETRLLASRESQHLNCYGGPIVLAHKRKEYDFLRFWFTTNFVPGLSEKRFVYKVEQIPGGSINKCMNIFVRTQNLLQPSVLDQLFGATLISVIFIIWSEPAFTLLLVVRCNGPWK